MTQAYCDQADCTDSVRMTSDLLQRDYRTMPNHICHRRSPSIDTKIWSMLCSQDSGLLPPGWTDWETDESVSKEIVVAVANLSIWQDPCIFRRIGTFRIYPMMPVWFQYISPQIGLRIADGMPRSLLVLKKDMTPPQILFLMYFVSPLIEMGSSHPRDCGSNIPQTNVGYNNDVTSQSTIVHRI